MTWGTIEAVSSEGAIVNIGEEAARQKPMKIPKNSDAAVGDNVAVEKISGTYVIIQIYGG